MHILLLHLLIYKDLDNRLLLLPFIIFFFFFFFRKISRRKSRQSFSNYFHLNCDNGTLSLISLFFSPNSCFYIKVSRKLRYSYSEFFKKSELIQIWWIGAFCKAFVLLHYLSIINCSKFFYACIIHNRIESY